MMSIPLAIPLWDIFKIESMEMCPKCACHILTEAEAVVVHVMFAASTLSPMYLVMYAFSIPIMVQGNLYNPLDNFTMPMRSSSELRIWHSLSMNRTLALSLVRWGTERRFVPICEPWRMSFMIAQWLSGSL